MTGLSRVLCAVDFSKPARAAFEKALALSQTQDAHLTIVHAVPADKPFRWHARKSNATIAALRRAAEAKGVRLSVSVQHGDPAGVIVLHAKARPFDLVVLGTHQRTGVERFRLGSVAERVVHRVPCPVLIVPASEHGASDSASSPVRSVLCPIDFTPASSGALEQALAIGQRAGARLTLVHVLPELASARTFRYGWHFSLSDYRHLLARNARQCMRAAIPAAALAAGAVQARVAAGAAADEIVRVAADVNADLIVMGVTVRGVMGRWGLGSTAARVMRRAGCAVLVVPESTQSRPLRGSNIKTSPGVLRDGNAAQVWRAQDLFCGSRAAL